MAEKPKKITYLSQVFEGISLGAIAFALLFIGLGIYSAVNYDPADFGGPIGCGDGTLLGGAGLAMLAVAFGVPAFSKEKRAQRAASN